MLNIHPNSLQVKKGEIVEQFTCTFDEILEEDRYSMLLVSRNDMEVDAIYVGTFTGK